VEAPIYASASGSVADIKVRERELIDQGYRRVYVDLIEQFGPKQYLVREASGRELSFEGGRRLTIAWREDP
jgi:hypothetical protein